MDQILSQSILSVSEDLSVLFIYVFNYIIFLILWKKILGFTTESASVFKEPILSFDIYGEC